MQKWKDYIRDYYEQLYGSKMDNLEEMDRYLEKFNLPRLNQEEIESMNNTITSTEIQNVINNPKKQKPRTRWLHRRIHQTFKELVPILPKILPKISKEGTLPMRPQSPWNKNQRQHKNWKI